MTRMKLRSLTVLLTMLIGSAHIPVLAEGSAPATAPGSTTSGASSTPGSAQSAPGTATVTVPLVVLIPVEQEERTLNNGCWVRLTDKDAMPKKGNDVLTVVGRMYMPSFETASGVNWSRKADSLTVGPKASVTVFSERDFKGSSAKLSGGQQVKDISKELGFVKSIDSLQVDCTA
ncbi:hypothetical protein [Noviherbaspirillum sp. ST9]|uniref:hypothetical protein n=1 Tax=Noviherbaspirillum sp. ST9 TaxID=3401606 RepID=UPI003B5872E0